MKWIVEDPGNSGGGAATFKGTRILVYQVGSLLAQGVSEDELRENYPNLTAAMMEAARIYVRAYPERGPRPTGMAERQATK